MPRQLSKPLVTKFEQLIKKKTGRQIPQAQLKDQQTERLLKLVEKKRSRHKDVVKVEVPARQQEGNVVDLMEVLKRSLAGKKKRA